MVRVCVDVKIEPVKVACVVECVFIIKSLFGNFSGDKLVRLSRVGKKSHLFSRNLEIKRRRKRDGWMVL